MRVYNNLTPRPQPPQKNMQAALTKDKQASIMGVASNEAREAVASSLFWIITRVSGVSHTPRTMCIRSDDKDRS